MDKVHSLSERQVMVIPSIFSSFNKPMHLCCSRQFDLFMKEELVPMVGTTRGRDDELQDPIILYDQALKKDTLDSRESAVVDVMTHYEIAAGASSSQEWG